MKKETNAIVFNKAGDIGTGSFPLGPCGATDIVVRTLYTMVSSGTELRVLAGHYGAKDRFPLIPGYSVVGEVIAVGEQAKGYRVGDLISGLALGNGVTLHSGEVEDLLLEEVGAERAVIRYRVPHRDGTGVAHLRSTVRVHVYAGQPFVKLPHRLEVISPSLAPAVSGTRVAPMPQRRFVRPLPQARARKPAC